MLENILLNIRHKLEKNKTPTKTERYTFNARCSSHRSQVFCLQYHEITAGRYINYHETRFMNHNSTLHVPPQQEWKTNADV